MKKSIRKTVASFLAFVMLVTCIPMEAFAAEEPTSVRLYLMDITAKYGENYKIRLYDRMLTEKGVQNAENSKSILETVKEAEENGELTEYNYSDTIIDGTVTAENQLTEEQNQTFYYILTLKDVNLCYLSIIDGNMSFR